MDEFQKLINKCQPHKAFNRNWQSFSINDFADAILPNIKFHFENDILICDGAALFKNTFQIEEFHSKTNTSNNNYKVVIFTYPKGVEAEIKKNRVLVSENEISVFVELFHNKKAEVFFKIGTKMQSILNANYQGNNLNNDSKIEIDNIFASTNNQLKDDLGIKSGTYAKYNIFSSVYENTGVNLFQLNNQLPSIRFTKITPIISEPTDNKQRKIKEKEYYIQIEFEILNQKSLRYKLLVYKNTISIFEQVYSIPESKSKKKSSYIEPGTYKILWDCSKNDIFNTPNKNQIIRIKVVATALNKQSIEVEKDYLIKNLINNPLVNNYIIVNEVDGQQIKIYCNDIIARQEKLIKRLPQSVYVKLSRESKLILNLPIIMAKLNLLYGALCQIHWLEGSKKSLKFPYSFFMSEERVKDVDFESIKIYFKNITYFSFENLGYIPSSQEGNIFLYNTSLDSIKESSDLFLQNLAKRKENGEIGGDEKLINEIELWNKIKNDTQRKSEYISENYFQSFSIGSALGNIDDLGTALGRYSLRCYFLGLLTKNTNTEKWILDITSVKCRFFDEFSFNDHSEFLKPMSWGSQNLGYWKNDITNPELPKKFSTKTDFILLENSDFRDLKSQIEKHIGTCCNDFFIYSDFKTISNEIVKKSIVIF